MTGTGERVADRGSRAAGWRADWPAPIAFSPPLWHPGYRTFWWDWLQNRKHLVLLRRGDWWQP